MRSRLALLISAAVLLLLLLVWRFQVKKHTTESSTPTTGYAPLSETSTAAPRASSSPDSAPTTVYAHNLMLRKGPSFHAAQSCPATDRNDRQHRSPIYRWRECPQG